MELVWVFLIAVITINVSNAKSIIDNISEKEVNKSTIPKVLRRSPRVIANRQNSSILPNLPDRREKFVVKIKPTTETENQTTEKNSSNRLMKKLPIKYVNYYSNTKLPAEITTRRSLMQIRRFTVKPHDIFAESVREKNNWNNNRKINTHKSRRPKTERPTTEKNIEPSKEEERFSNFKNVDSSINDNDSDELGKEEQKTSYVAAGSQKSKTMVLSPKKNYTKYLKVDPEQKTSKRRDEKKSDSENKVSTDVVNKNDTITEDKKTSIISDKVLNKTEHKDNSSDQQKTDSSELMLKNGVTNDVSFVGTNVISTSPAGVVGDIEISSQKDADFVVT